MTLAVLAAKQRVRRRKCRRREWPGPERPRGIAQPPCFGDRLFLSLVCLSALIAAAGLLGDLGVLAVGWAVIAAASLQRIAAVPVAQGFMRSERCRPKGLDDVGCLPLG
jgi:hypothetical protein